LLINDNNNNAIVAIIIRTGIYRLCEYDTELLRLMVKLSPIDLAPTAK